MVNYSIREIIRKIGYDDWPIHFIEISANTPDIFYFKPISDREYNDVIRLGGAEDSLFYKHYENEIGAYMPDATVSEVIEFEKNRCEIRMKLYWDFMAERINVEGYDWEIVYCTFCILHEIGHWCNYFKLGLNPVEYVRAEKIEIDKDNKFHDKIAQENDGLIRENLIKEEFVFYRNMKNERAADQYAFENIKESLERIYIPDRN